MNSLPRHPEAEVALINLLLGTKEAALRALVELKSEMFFDVENGYVFEASSRLTNQGLDISAASLSAEFQHMGLESKIDLSHYEPDVVYTEGKFKTLSKLITESFNARCKIQIAEKIVQTGYQARDLTKFLRESDELYWNSTATTNRDLGMVSSGDMLETRNRDMRERINRIPVMTGFPELDEHLVGGCFTRGQVSVIAGRPNMGKSFFKATLIKNLCEAGIGVASFAIEQSREIEMDRMDTLITRITSRDLRNVRYWNEGDARILQVQDAQRLIDSKWNYHLIYRRGLTLSDCFVRLQQIQNQRPVRVVFFDLFDKLIDVNVSQNKPQTVGKKLGEASIMAEALDAHICLLVQINREVDKRKDKRPTMSDLKDSGSYEEVARQVLLLYRDSYYNPDNLTDIMEVIVGKQNDGPTGVKTDFEFNPEGGILQPINLTTRIYGNTSEPRPLTGGNLPVD